MGNCEKCGIVVKGDYKYCWSCLQKEKEKIDNKTISNKPVANVNDVPELLKNINTGIWRLVVYAEHLLVDKGYDPKKLRDDSWKRKQKEDEGNKDNPLQ